MPSSFTADFSAVSTTNLPGSKVFPITAVSYMYLRTNQTSTGDKVRGAAVQGVCRGVDVQYLHSTPETVLAVLEGSRGPGFDPGRLQGHMNARCGAAWQAWPVDLLSEVSIRSPGEVCIRSSTTGRTGNGWRLTGWGQASRHVRLQRLCGFISFKKKVDAAATTCLPSWLRWTGRHSCMHGPHITASHCAT